jgi:hypothetical protein
MRVTNPCGNDVPLICQRGKILTSGKKNSFMLTANQEVLVSYDSVEEGPDFV